MRPGLVGLAEAVRELRSEVAEAMAGAEGERVQFSLDTVEMEFQVAVTQEVRVEAGVKFWVVNAGGKAGEQSRATHRVTLSLTPKDTIGGGSPLIADEE